ncbi:hypothetical protein K435DRAFT_810203 [Dendrothele bispora CBS 962.96]|uniref:Bacteriophage T5 Orf172 DNA-binding domain-containing protein n=1 Tax=Dendrothele bispora (strain CBS 962.96) TaxID=1314807 RepID=A0A4S8KW04_DENBC|nr:hypothetical protein K435DRAFT_810203 [Dendrothele bispora CBS 962.96]
MRDDSGYIYVLEAAQTDIKKIGFTQRDPITRLKEWRRSCPSMDFALKSCFQCRRVKRTEKIVHSILAQRRPKKHACPDCRRRHRELFSVTARDADLVIFLANILA